MEGCALLRPTTRADAISELAARVEAVERRDAGRGWESVLSGWGPPLESLVCGVLHEWCGPGRSGRDGTMPLLLLAHLASQALRQRRRDRVVWIGSARMWPQPHALGAGVDDGGLVDRSLLVDPPTGSDRLWAIDLCLRSPAVAAVVADAAGLTLAHTRRLQLAAEAGGALALLARPLEDLGMPSAAAIRCRVECMPSPTMRPRWSITINRCKGMQRRSGMEAGHTLILEHHRATGCLRVPAQLADRPAQASARHAG